MRLAIDHRKKTLPAVYRFNLLHEGLVMLQKLVDAFELHPKLCYLDRSVFTEQDHAFLPPPAVYNGKVRTALESLDEQLPTMAILDEGKSPGEKLCLLMERGIFMEWVICRKRILQKALSRSGSSCNLYLITILSGTAFIHLRKPIRKR